MTPPTDLVDRLRDLYAGDVDNYELAGEAADEMARLRRDYAEAVDALNRSNSVNCQLEAQLAEAQRRIAALEAKEAK